MDTLRRLLAFPMFATVAWLVWVLGQQSGIDGAGALLALLVAVSAVVWALGLRGRSRLVLAPATAAIAAVLLITWGPAIVQPQAPVQTEGAASTALWQPWSADKVQALGAQGQPVFVDFTAAWCVTCQVNKKTTLSNAEVLADFQARNVALLRADWTRQDPAITQALTSLGRSGVPVYVLYRPQQAPLVMTEILSPSQVRAALASL
jgi:thiol:disulfide interchange protein DsbD